MAEVWRFFAHEDDFADIDEVGACSAQAACCRFRRFRAWMPRRWTEQPFDDLRAYMRQAWPLRFTAGKVRLSSIIRYW